MSGKLINNFRDNIYKELPVWLRANNSTIAIWIQTGSWDFAYTGFNFAMGHFMKVFVQILSYIQQEINRVPYHVNLRVIGTAPMPDKWHNNNFVIGAFNARVRAIIEKLNIDFTDAFQFELPCHNQLARLGRNKNHYFHREKNIFRGNVGSDVYFGYYFPKVCAIFPLISNVDSNVNSLTKL